VITGSNFISLKPVSVYWDTTSSSPVVTARASLQGSFTARFIVPQGHAGNHTIIVASSVTTATVVVQMYPKVTLSRYTGVPGRQVVASGYGFGPNEVVTVNWDSPPVTLGSTTTDALGSFTGSRAITITVPMVPPGGHFVFAIGQSSGVRGVTDFVVL
jgi:hypothetical protein